MTSDFQEIRSTETATKNSDQIGSRWRYRLIFIALTFMTFLKTMPFIIQIGSSDSSFGEISAPFYFYYRVTLMVSIIILFLVKLLRPAIHLATMNKASIILVFYIATSSLWSFDGYISLRASAEVFSLICLALLLNIYCNIQEIAKICLHVIGISLVLSVVWAVAFPTYGVHAEVDLVQGGHAGDWRGIYLHKNNLGATAGIAVPVLFFYGRRILENRLLWPLYIAANITCLINANSGSAWIIVALGLPFVGILNLRDRNLRYSLLVSALVFACIAAVSSDQVISAVLDALGKDATISGRTLLWHAAWQMFLDSPIVGYGYFSSSNQAIVDTFVMANRAENAHNAYLQMLLDGGLCGAAIWASGLVRPVNNIIAQVANKEVDPGYGVFATLLWCGAISGMSEISTSNIVDTLIGNFWMISVVTLSSQRSVLAKRRDARNTTAALRYHSPVRSNP